MSGATGCSGVSRSRSSGSGRRSSVTRFDILYIDWDWWLELSGGTRRPRDAARRILEDEGADATAAEHEPLAAALQTTPPPPELIAVTTTARTPLVLVEGHARLTAYALFPDYLPAKLEILLGVSDEMPRWCQF